MKTGEQLKLIGLARSAEMKVLWEWFVEPAIKGFFAGLIGTVIIATIMVILAQFSTFLSILEPPLPPVIHMAYPCIVITHRRFGATYAYEKLMRAVGENNCSDVKVEDLP